MEVKWYREQLAEVWDISAEHRMGTQSGQWSLQLPMKESVRGNLLENESLELSVEREAGLSHLDNETIIKMISLRNFLYQSQSPLPYHYHITPNGVIIWTLWSFSSLEVNLCRTSPESRRFSGIKYKCLEFRWQGNLFCLLCMYPDLYFFG